jgi:tetratricopeptide (TPR) repeat protein
MTTTDLDELLQRGITAVQMGHADTAKECFMAIITANDRHEAAWFWLSQVVEDVEEQRICLENVLTLNPNYPQAERLLDQLTETVVDPRQRPALSAAAAILHPERQDEDDNWPPPEKHEAPVIHYTSSSQFDDVWAREVDICAYCAHELGHKVGHQQQKCPHCHHKLIAWQYRYEQPSTSLHIYWVLVLGLGQFFFIQSFYDIVIQRDLLRSILSVTLMVICFILAAGIYWRQLWSHYLTMAFLVGFVVLQFLALFVPFSLAGVPLQGIDPAISELVGDLFAGFGDVLRMLQIVAAILALIYAVMWATPDFDRVTLRRLAWVNKRPKFASDYHMLAKNFAEADLWATAILHWQYAVSRAPTQAVYMIHLGRAYQHLGFSERSRDILQTALKHSKQPEQQATIQQLLQNIDQETK